VIEYAGTMPITSGKDYTYTSQHRLPKSISQLDSQGRIERSETTYVFEDTSGNQNMMLTHHLFNYPIEQTSYINNILAKRKSYEYGVGLSPGKPLLIFLHKVSEQVGNNPGRITTTFARYDDYGNPVSVETSSGEKYALNWTYYGTYLQKKILGYTYAEATARTGEALPSISYTYFPLIGISSETNEFGKTIYYRYDAWGRLLERYQLNTHQKEVLDYYQYHYK
jgi:hypothetical protein